MYANNENKRLILKIYRREINWEIATKNFKKFFGERFESEVTSNHRKDAEEDQEVSRISFLIRSLDKAKNKILTKNL